MKEEDLRVRRQGFEPRTRGLREDRCTAPSALPAQTRHAKRSESTQCTMISYRPFHEIVPRQLGDVGRTSVTERSSGPVWRDPRAEPPPWRRLASLADVSG